MNRDAEQAIQANDLRTAADLLSECIRTDPFHRKAVLNSADLFGRLCRPELAAPILRNFLDRYPNDHTVAARLKLIDTAVTTVARQKLAVLCPPGMDRFVNDLRPLFDSVGEVRVASDGSNSAINEAVAWAETIWVEWGSELAVALTRALPLDTNKRVICRLHSYEAFGPYPEQMNWERIDDLILVAPQILAYLRERIPDLDLRVKRIHVVPNGIDLDRLPFAERKPGRNLAFLGYINYKKGPMLLLHAFAALLQADPEYRLFLGGEYQDDRYRLYFARIARELGVEGRLIFDGWIDDVPKWLEDKQYIVCSSVLESQGMGILEAMACGVKPIVHNFVGADEVYDRRFLWTSIDQFVAQVRSQDYDSQSYRAFVGERYSIERTNKLLEVILSR